ncbi:RelA/SpoT family protein [Micrococcoides hystricis]|uniref:RelA/SpoT family protein n=1 Tax=Micrococcoides hystricis TaxID=1572761 RepID=A0ABV6P7J2_9MICC
MTSTDPTGGSQKNPPQNAGPSNPAPVAFPPTAPIQVVPPPKPTVRRPRSRLKGFGGRGPEYSPMLEPLLRTVRVQHPREDLDFIIRAFETAEKYHEGQRRKSGDPYITHPVAVATILADLGLSGTTLAAALLHDTVEDTEYTLEQLTADFGEEVALLVDGVTKLDSVDLGTDSKVETLRKMVVAMSRDIRVLLIKLADRLHNARTWRYVSPESSARKAKETLDIFAPLAHRLGMNTIKWELEDLSFAALQPKIYEELVRLVGERTPEREKYVNGVTQEIEADLREAKIRGQVSGRPKHYFSIYQKMVNQNKAFNDIHDLIGVRVLVDTVGQCYAVLGAVHARWTPLGGRFKDYIANPKFNLYQSLHTTVVGPLGRPVEIQIRTFRMHQLAEYGVAAHWKYKQGSKTGDMRWLRSVVDWQKNTQDPNEFFQSLQFEINAQEVFVYTPKGTVMSLPAGSTPVDFAYAIHTDIGNSTIGARVNNRLVPLNTTLENGDRVEIIRSKSPTASPSRDWLNFVQSGKARSRIRHWYSKERRVENIEVGKDMLSKALRKSHGPAHEKATPQLIAEVAETMNYADTTALYSAIGEGHISTQNVLEKLNQLIAPTPEEDSDEVPTELTDRSTTVRPIETGGSDIIVEGGADGLLVKLARCCAPMPPDEITGYVTRGSGISVHRVDCDNIRHMKEEAGRLLKVRWAETVHSTFLVEITVEALDRPSLLLDVTKVLSDHHVDIRKVDLQTTKEQVAIAMFAFEMSDSKYLDTILNAIRRIDGVYDVYRSMDRRRRR